MFYSRKLGGGGRRQSRSLIVCSYYCRAFTRQSFTLSNIRSHVTSTCYVKSRLILHYWRSKNMVRVYISKLKRCFTMERPLKLRKCVSDGKKHEKQATNQPNKKKSQIAVFAPIISFVLPMLSKDKPFSLYYVTFLALGDSATENNIFIIARRPLPDTLCRNMFAHKPQGHNHASGGGGLRSVDSGRTSTGPPFAMLTMTYSHKSQR
jgi:hypothetical protein